MKNIKLTLLFSCFLTLAFAQKLKLRRIYKVQEKAAVDSMINEFKRDNYRSEYKNDSCFSLNIVRQLSNNFYFDLSYLRRNKSIITIGENDIFKKNNLRFFTYKNNLIFLTGEGDPFNLFSGTHLKKTFKFKHTKTDTNALPDIIELFGKTYNYKDGKFIWHGADGHKE